MIDLAQLSCEANPRPLPAALANQRDPMFDMAPKGTKGVVEIGTRNGWWAHRCLKQLPKTRLYCIDPLDPKATLAWACNCARGIDEGRVSLIKMRSERAAEDFNIEIDLLFIDGDHRGHAVLADLTMWVPKVRPGGLIVGHDWKGKWAKFIRPAVLSFWGKDQFFVDDLYYSCFKNKLKKDPCFWRLKGNQEGDMAEVICFDIDGICTEDVETDYEDLSGTWAHRKPNLKTRDLIRKAILKGWTVILFTGRREGDRRLTENWLYANGFMYHYLFMGKPYFKYIVDDRARTIQEIEELVDGKRNSDP